MNDAAGNATIRLLADKDAIRDLAMMYTRASDRGDFALLEKLYTRDGRDSRGKPDGLASQSLADVPKLLSTVRMVQHNISHHLIAVDGDYAEGEVTNLSYHVLERDGRLFALSVSGRYLDKYRREDGLWKIADRHITIDWVREDEIASEFPNDRYTNGMEIGQKDETDFSYRFFTLLKRGERS